MIVYFLELSSYHFCSCPLFVNKSGNASLSIFSLRHFATYSLSAPRGNWKNSKGNVTKCWEWQCRWFSLLCRQLSTTPISSVYTLSSVPVLKYPAFARGKEKDTCRAGYSWLSRSGFHATETRAKLAIRLAQSHSLIRSITWCKWKKYEVSFNTQC